MRKPKSPAAQISALTPPSHSQDQTNAKQIRPSLRISNPSPPPCDFSLAMATTARSPSPGPARPCCHMRRSADSSPFTVPATSDSPQRSSSVCKNGGGSPRAWCAEKENEQRDAARTPKARSGGGKGFMAPTISAASKASPRKKVLGERNEQQHPVPSSPADLAQRPKGPPEPAVATPRRLRLSFDGAPAASHGSRHSFGGEEARMENPVCNNHHHHAVGVAAASEDLEPSQAAAVPYDPKTNYLSPRPRFLHYKPNPRIELYRHGGSGVRRLEDGFASDSESSEETDTTATTEEELTEEGQEQAQPSSVPNDLPEESSDLAAQSEDRAEAAVPAEACVLPPEPAPSSPRARVLTPEPVASSPRARALTPEPSATSPRARDLTPEPEPAASSARARAKKGSSLRFLLAPLALVLFMAAAFVCVPPPPVSPVISNTALSKVSEFLSVQELHPVELAAWLKQWSSSSLDLVTSYWEALSSAREQELFGPHFAANLSAAAAADADHSVDFYYNFAETSAMPSEEPIGDGVLEQKLEIQDVVSASDTELITEVEMAKVGDVAREEEPFHSAEVEQEAVPARASVMEEANEYGEGLVVEDEFKVEMSEEVPGSNGEEMASFSQNLDIPSHPTGEPEQVDNLASSESSLKQDVQSDESEGDRTDSKEDHVAYHGLKSEVGMWPGYLDKISKPTAVGVALAAVILSAVLAFLYMRQKQAQVAMNATAPAEQTEQVVETQSGSGSSERHLLGKGSQLQNPVAEETERFGGSGASMYSSSLSSGHGRRRKAKEEESLSLEPRSRRESTTYSTSSYGSFTTYEKIPAKKRNKEDEAMTPVRRSSRLMRSQVKSPEA